MSECPEGMIIQLEPKYAARSSFEAEVSDVRIFIYDSNDEQVSVVDATGEQLAADGYCVTVHIPVGKYRLVVWNGLSDTTNYTEDNASVALNTVNNATERSFKPLWHGAANDIEVENLNLTKVTVPMVKDTNNVVVFLCTTNGEILNPNEFDFTITASNGAMGQDNAVLPGKEITYNDYSLREEVVEGTLAADYSTTNDLGELYMVRSELNTLRITEGNEALLHIFYRETGRNIITLNLNDYIAKAFRSDMSTLSTTVQEYFDTEDLFNITLFLTPRTGRDNPDEPPYYVAALRINKWILRVQPDVLLF
jgi:hypothetical protein